MATVTSPNGDYIAKPPPPPPPAVQKTTYSGHDAAARSAGENDDLLNGVVLVLRATASLFAFVAVALVASCRHGDWMEFAHYQEYRYLLGVTVVAFVYSAAQALRHFRRMRSGGYAYAARSGSFLDFAGDQVVAYLLITASSAALPITIRMRSAVVNVFTDAIAACICLGFLAFAALALSATLSCLSICRQAYHN